MQFVSCTARSKLRRGRAYLGGTQNRRNVERDDRGSLFDPFAKSGERTITTPSPNFDQSALPASEPEASILRTSEPWCRALLDALPSTIYTTDAAGRITYYNEAAVQLLGCRPELGRSEFYGSWQLY
jgi:PAS domain-containing protein